MDNKYSERRRSIIKNPIRSIPQICWIAIFVCIAWSGYGVAGKSGLAHFFVLMLLSFPLSWVCELSSISQRVEMGDGALTLTPIIVFFIIGYFQWFILLSYVIMKSKKLFNKKCKQARANGHP